MSEDNHQLPMTGEEDCLLRTASAGDVPDMERLLTNAMMLSAACRVKSRLFSYGLARNVPHLLVMMHAAAKTGQASMVEYLLYVGNVHGIQPTELIDSASICNAILSKEVGVLRIMFAAMPSLISFNLGMRLSPLEQSVATGDIPIITFLLENGADPNHSFNPNDSLLQDAAGRSTLQIVELLLWYGASTSKSWPCHAAARYGRVEVLMVLVEHGADINKKFIPQPGSYYEDSESPLDVAVRHEQPAAAKWLADNGAVRNVMSTGNQNPERSIAQFNSNLTQEQWRSLIDDDEDTPEKFAARMAARKERREQNRLARMAQASGSIEDTSTA